MARTRPILPDADVISYDEMGYLIEALERLGALKPDPEDKAIAALRDVLLKASQQGRRVYIA